MPNNFMTQGGLKVRLDLNFFMQLVTGEQKKYRSSEIAGNSFMDSMVSMTEQRFVIPNMLRWYFSICAILFFSDIKLFQFAAIHVIIFLFGSLWRIIVPDAILNFVINVFGAIYAMLSRFYIIPYLILIAMGIYLKSIDLLIAYYVLSFCLIAFEGLLNEIALSTTKKKFGIAFNDTELTAFSTFYIFLGPKCGLRNFIESYCQYINEKNQQSQSL